MLLIVIIDLIDYYEIINILMLLHSAQLLVHHNQELINVDQTLAILICHFDHLLYFTISDIYSQLLQNSLKVISTLREDFKKEIDGFNSLSMSFTPKHPPPLSLNGKFGYIF